MKTLVFLISLSSVTAFAQTAKSQKPLPKYAITYVLTYDSLTLPQGQKLEDIIRKVFVGVNLKIGVHPLEDVALQDSLKKMLAKGREGNVADSLINKAIQDVNHLDSLIKE